MNHALIPAAGRSSRLGRSKALLPLQSTTVIGALVSTLRRAGIERVWVVAAAGDLPLARFCELESADLVVSSTPELGMLSSIQRGLEVLEPHLEADDTLLLCPVDHAAIRTETVERVLAAARTAPSGIAVASFRGRRSHPLALSASSCSLVQRLERTIGLRQLYELRPVTGVETTDPAVRLDLDTWSDHAAMIEHLEALGRS